MSYEETWAKAAEADSQITKHFDHWLTLARGLSGMRDHLRAKSGANSDASPIYRRAYAEWVPTRPWAAKWSSPKKSSFRTACYWLIENEAEVETWRASLDPLDRDRWQSPEVVMREFRKAKRPLVAQDPNAPKKETAKDGLLRELDELRAKYQAMKSNGGSLFDLQDSSAATIARAMAEELINSGRFTKLLAVQTGIAKEIAAYKARLKSKAQAG
jgi:hypothetical protein